MDDRSPNRKLVLSLLEIMGEAIGKSIAYPWKRQRNYLIHYLLTEQTLDWPGIRKYIRENYPTTEKLGGKTKGRKGYPLTLKGKTQKQDIKAMQANYYPWLMDGTNLADYAEWRKVFVPI